MKQLVCTTPGEFNYQEAAIPGVPAGHVLLQVKRIGVCGTDLHAFEGTQPYFSYPRILGHEIAAVTAATDHNDFATGEAVTIVPYFHCGACIACRSGKPNCCVQLNVCGVHIDGAMQEYFVAPSHALVKSGGLSLDELAMVEPLAIGAHSIRLADVKTGEFVLVAGAGPIGLGVMEFARIAGAHVIAMDVQEGRLRFCKDQLQVAHTIHPHKENTMKKLLEITNGEMPSVVIDATGNLQAINQSFQYLSHGGRSVLVGLQRSDISFSHPEFHKREATLMSSRNATHEDFSYVIQCIQSGSVQPFRYITHRSHFSDVKDVFTQWLDPANAVIKAMIYFD